MNINSYVDTLKKYTQFTGRARRTEFWFFFLVNAVISIALTFLFGLIKMHMLANIFSLAILCPGIAVGIRRMHDIGKSGWFILIPIYDIVLWATPGVIGDNQYGPDPKAGVAK